MFPSPHLLLAVSADTSSNSHLHLFYLILATYGLLRPYSIRQGIND